MKYTLDNKTNKAIVFPALFRHRTQRADNLVITVLATAENTGICLETNEVSMAWADFKNNASSWEHLGNVSEIKVTLK